MQHLLLLHGAIGSKAQFEPLVQKLKDKYTIHTLNFSGHGDADMPELFSIERFADEVSAYLSKNNIASINIFGYSMGGYVALYLAKTSPEKVNRIFTLATKFSWTPDIAARETKMLNADKISEKIPAFAQELEKRHQPNDWKIVLRRTADMMIGLGTQSPLQTADYSSITVPVRIAIGDKDTMVTLEETIEVYRALPNASLSVLPNTQHPIDKVPVQQLANEIQSFF